MATVLPKLENLAMQAYKEYSKTACFDDDKGIISFGELQRGRRLLCKPNEIEKLLRFFIKTHVAPEIDSIRFSKLATSSKNVEENSYVAIEKLKQKGAKDIIIFRNNGLMWELTELSDNDLGGFRHIGMEYPYLALDKTKIFTFAKFNIEDLQQDNSRGEKMYSFKVIYGYRFLDSNIGEYIYKGW